MKISNYMSEELIRLDVEAREKFSLLEELSRILGTDERVIDSKQLAEDIVERERIEPTGIGEGVAIPHARTDSVSDIIIFIARLKKPIDYSAIDGKPVNLLFLIGTPKDAVQVYLKLLASLTKLVKNDSVRERFTAAGTPSEILEIVKENELD
ncbi:MAG: PTS sugar transporter subunit IIA [Candidatus Glassbacteria bacterium]